MAGFAVLDFETTGLFPQKHDRVVEVGLVVLDDTGSVERAWSTLVNPQRDVGPTSIHGIGARDVLRAPTFADVAPLLVDDLRGRTLVAHNARFELLFLEYELRRAGWALPDERVPGLCTMEWSAALLPSAPRRLADCCASAGITIGREHCALEDARATAQLMASFIEAAAALMGDWSDLVMSTRGFAWPSVVAAPPALVERGAAPVRRPSEWMDGIVAGMPRHESAAVESYLEILEAALLDRYLSDYEEQSLCQMAELLGMDLGSVVDVHRHYLSTLAGVAWADGVVTPDERADLVVVAQMLGLSDDDVDRELESASSAEAAEGREFRLVAGDAVCITGQMSLPRSHYEALVHQAGLVVGGLTKSTRLLVAADPDSMSGKARKARAYGVPVVNEACFVEMVRALAPA